MLQFHSRRRGSTWPEYMVPLTIIGFLSVILFPVYGRARKNAYRSECQTNLQQIVLAVAQYAKDNDGYYPAAVRGESSPNATGKHTLGWADAILPYLKSSEYYQCPGEPNWGSPDPANTNYVDYWYNPALSWNGKHGTGTRWNRSRTLESESQAADTVMLGDAGKEMGMGTATSRCNGYECRGDDDISSPSYDGPSGKVSSHGFAGGGLRHLDGINIAFADGHVKWKRSTGPNSSDQIYNLFTPLKVSGSDPTFNVN